MSDVPNTDLLSVSDDKCVVTSQRRPCFSFQNHTVPVSSKLVGDWYLESYFLT